MMFNGIKTRCIAPTGMLVYTQTGVSMLVKVLVKIMKSSSLPYVALISNKVQLQKSS